MNLLFFLSLYIIIKINFGGMSNCGNCFGGKSSVFNVLSAAQKDFLKENGVYIEYKKNEIIFNEGYRPQGLITLAKGKVKIFKEGVGGREQIVRLAKPCDFIGFRALFASDYYIASAQAIEDSAVCIFDKQSLYKLIEENTRLAFGIISLLANQLGKSTVRTVSLTQKHIRGRLAESLIVLADIYGMEEDQKTIKVVLAREDIANLSNMTVSNAIRTLASFASENLIDLAGKKIKILNRAEIERISNAG